MECCKCGKTGHLAKDCRVAVRGIVEHEGEEAISWACMIDSEFNDRNVAGGWRSIPKTSMAGRKQKMKHIGEMNLEELESAMDVHRFTVHIHADGPGEGCGMGKLEVHAVLVITKLAEQLLALAFAIPRRKLQEHQPCNQA